MNDKEFFAYQHDLNAEMYSHAHGYIQGLVVAGYAGVFFLWDQLKGEASPWVWALAGLLLALSLGIYLIWEIFAFLFRQRVAMDFAHRIVSSQDIGREEFYRLGEETKRKLRQFILPMRRWWAAAMVGVVAPLVAAWILIGGLFVVRVIRVLAAWIG